MAQTSISIRMDEELKKQAEFLFLEFGMNMTTAFTIFAKSVRTGGHQLNKVIFKGIIRSIQPRIRLTRSFDESSHTYLGYAIVLSGWVDNGVEFAPSDHDHNKPAGFEQVFSIGIGKATQEKNKFNTGDVISGDCVSVADGQPELMKRSALPVSGAVGCRSRSSLITGIPAKRSIELKHSAMGHLAVNSTRLGQIERLKDAMAWCMSFFISSKSEQ